MIYRRLSDLAAAFFWKPVIRNKGGADTSGRPREQSGKPVLWKPVLEAFFSFQGRATELKKLFPYFSGVLYFSFAFPSLEDLVLRNPYRLDFSSFVPVITRGAIVGASFRAIALVFLSRGAGGNY